MANTNILIKRSSSTRKPSSLAAGELAYSYQSNTLFLGTAAGNGVINVGGIYYTQAIDNATDIATPNSLVKRDATGNASFHYVDATYFVGTFEGNAVTATALENGRNFKISGGDIAAANVSFNGTGDVVLNASLNAIPGLTAGSYGSSTSIPVLTVAANGRVISVSTETISTEFTLAGDVGTTLIEGGDTLTVYGGAGITSFVDTDGLYLDVDDTVVRSNTAITSQTIDGNITIAGNLTVQGTHTFVNTATLNVVDPLIILASNNSSDAVDIGFAGHYTDGSAVARHTGMFRDAGTKEFYVFDGYTPGLTGNVIDVADASFNLANLNVGTIRSEGIISGNVNLTSAITILQGVNTTQNTNISAADTKAQNAFDKANNSVQASIDFTFGQMVVADGTDSLKSLANASYTLTGTLGASKTITSLSVDAYGRVTAATAGDIGIAAAAVSGLAAIATSGAYSDLTGAPNLASIATSGSGSDISSGTVSVLYGGTGRNTFTTNGLIFGNSTDGLLVTASAGTADQTFSNQILTVTNAGVPVWSSALDGGTF